MSAPSERRDDRRPMDVVVRPMTLRDLDVADHVMRVAFGTYMNLPDPTVTFGPAQYVRSRFAAAPEWSFVAELDDEVVGSVFVTRWGSFGFFGPLTVHPDLWDRGIARQLMMPVVDAFDHWPVRLAGLHTFAQSTKHVNLYQSFGFWPRYLTSIMSKEVGALAGKDFELFSHVRADQRATTLSECASLTNEVFDGLDVQHEITAVRDLDLGDTVLLFDDERLVAIAVFHCGAGEAASGAFYVKFAAVRPGAQAPHHFDRLLGACERAAHGRGAQTIIAGVNTGRHLAYRQMLTAGFTSAGQGVRMHRSNAEGYCGPQDFVIDDLR